MRIKKLVIHDKSVEVVLGEYGEVGLLLYPDRVRIEWCNQIDLEALLEAIESAKKQLRCLGVWGGE